MSLLKKILAPTLFVAAFLFIGVNEGFSRVEELPAGCSIKVLGQDTPCTKVWCQSTWSMSGCGAGEVTSQECIKWQNC